MIGITLAAALLIVIFVSQVWLRPSKAKCPNCKSGKVTMIHHEVERVSSYDLISGEGGGKMLMMEIKETFRCSECERVWVRKRKEA